MLFLLHKPTNLLIQSHQKLIITTPNQLIFTSINFIQQYLTRKLIYPSPQQITYSKQTSQTIIITKQSIQMYWTDWHLNIQLRCFVNLVEEKVYSNIWDGKWMCFGDFQQYSTKNIKLVKIYNHQEEFSSCFLAQLQIILTNKRLVGYNHKEKILQKIKWSNPIDRLFIGHPKMTAKKHNSGVIILSIDNIYLHIHEQQVIFTKQHEGELFINSQTAIWINPGKNMIIYSITEKQLILLGEIEVYEGHYISSTVNGDKLILLFYEFRELQIKTINLVDPSVNIQYENRKKEKDRIRVQINSNRQKQNEKIDSIINSSTTPELSNNLKGFLKTSISRFQEEMNKSFQSRHFELKQSLKESQIVLAQPKAQDQKLPTLQIQLQSLGMVSEQLKDHSGLFEHGESGFEWQQLEKEHFEQNQDPSNIAKDLSISQTNEQNQMDFAETPAFNFQGTNPWGHYHQNWPESDVIREKSDSSKGQKYPSSQVSKKSGSQFDKNNSSLYSAPDNRKFTTILGQIYRKQPDRFDDALESCLQKLIHQDEARIFFADIIRIHNPDLTKDRLLRLYRLIPDTEENRRSMGKALSQFRLQQVPWACLTVRQTILKIYQKIYPAVYIQDLLNPNLLLFEQFIQSYFSQNYTSQILQIEDQKIQISHPRNLLNIILYLNEEYSFPLELVFQIYTKKLIRHEKLSIIKKLSDSNVCQICHIDNKIFQKSAEQIAREILQEGIINRGHLEGIVGLMGGKKKRFYHDALILIEHFNQEGCKFSIRQLLDLPANKNASSFFNAIRQNNSAAVLASLNMPLIFKKLLNLEESNSMYYQVWQIEACKQISQILLKNNYFKQAIRLLVPIGVNIKRSFLAKILLKYFNGDYLQQLISKNTQPSKTVTSILQSIQNQQPPLTQSQSLQKDQNTTSWKQFKSICSSRLTTTQWQLFYLIYNDKLLTKQLVTEGLLGQEDYQYFMTQMSSKKNNTFDWLNMNFTYKQVPLIISSDSSENQRESKLQQLLFEDDYPKLLLQRSYKGYDSIKQIQSMNLAKSVRYDEQQTDPNLILLKLQVQNSAVMEMLRQIYEESPKDRFLLAIGLVDRQKITLNNIQLFKSMVHLNLGYPFEKLIPFDYFLDDDQLCWKETSRRIRWELNWQNFWIIYTLVSMIYRRENDVAKMFIEKIIIYELNDRSEQQILKLLSIINLQPHQIASLLQLATQLNLQKITQALESH